MRLSVYRSLWGLTDGSMEPLQAALRSIKGLGYAGVETPVKLALHVGVQTWADLLQEHDLQCIYHVFSDGPVAPGIDGVFGGAFPGHSVPGHTVEEHVETLWQQVELCFSIPNTSKVNSHSGNDFWSRKDAHRFFEQVLQRQCDTGLSVCHETHRSRILYSPWLLQEAVDPHPTLRLTADLSHFTAVSEAGPCSKQLTRVVQETVAPRSDHVHGRIGYEEGPQVTDPRSEVWSDHVQGFLEWWSIIWTEQRRRGVSVSTFTPEHGPFPYQHCHPSTQEPLAPLSDVNHWVALQAQRRFAAQFGPNSVSLLTEAARQ